MGEGFFRREGLRYSPNKKSKEAREKIDEKPSTV